MSLVMLCVVSRVMAGVRSPNPEFVARAGEDSCTRRVTEIKSCRAIALGMVISIARVNAGIAGGCGSC